MLQIQYTITNISEVKMNSKIVNLNSHGDERGNLIAIEGMKDLPFDIKRVYYIFGTGKGVRRGFHAHKKLKQLLICVSGKCKIFLDNGDETQVVVLDEPNKGLYIENDIWREMYDFTKDAVLLVLASEYYDENDYIRNYKDFLEYVRRSDE